MTCPAKQMLFVLCLHLLRFVEPMSYDELRNLGVSCPPRDSCQHRNETYVEHQTCECDYSCNRRGTCCIDSPYLNVSTSKRETCAVLRSLRYGLTGVRVIAECDKLWNGSLEVKEMCEADPWEFGIAYMLIPASNPNTGIIYWNYFCSVCNDDSSNVILWDFDVERQRIPWDFTSEGLEFGTYLIGRFNNATLDGYYSLEYDRRTRKFGYWETLSLNKTNFVPVDILVKEPWFQRLQFCEPGTIQKCAPDWINDTIREMCESYMAAVWVFWKDSNNTYDAENFRNIHCAICNHVTNIIHVSCLSVSKRPWGITWEVKYHMPMSRTDITKQLGRGVRDVLCLKKGEKFIEKLSKCRPVFDANF